MTNILREAPLNQPRLITQRQLGFMRRVFEREVINPLFFGQSGENPKLVQAEIDGAVHTFNAVVSENFIISNLREITEEI